MFCSILGLSKGFELVWQVYQALQSGQLFTPDRWTCDRNWPEVISLKPEPAVFFTLYPRWAVPAHLTWNLSLRSFPLDRSSPRYWVFSFSFLFCWRCLFLHLLVLLHISLLVLLLLLISIFADVVSSTFPFSSSFVWRLYRMTIHNESNDVELKQRTLCCHWLLTGGTQN